MAFEIFCLDHYSVINLTFFKILCAILAQFREKSYPNDSTRLFVERNEFIPRLHRLYGTIHTQNSVRRICRHCNFMTNLLRFTIINCSKILKYTLRIPLVHSKKVTLPFFCEIVSTLSVYLSNHRLRDGFLKNKKGSANFDDAVECSWCQIILKRNTLSSSRFLLSQI